MYDKILLKYPDVFDGYKNFYEANIMRIKESAENYLEAILMINKQKGCVRSIDVANELGFSKASVSVAMKSFREDGYINVDPDGNLSLTEKGMEIATTIYEKHQIIAKILIAIGVSPETAYEDSCKIEHDLSNESFDRIKDYYTQNIENR